jgi:hypothetical protein
MKIRSLIAATGAISPVRKVDDIVSSLNKAVVELEAANEHNYVEARRLKDESDALVVRAGDHIAEAERAHRIAQKVRGLLS